MFEDLSMALELQGISKVVAAETHIFDTSITFTTGQFNVLLGATNAGKTSLIKLIAGLEKPTTGKIVLDNVDITKLNPQKRNVSLVHQFFINYPNMTVYDNIASPLKVAKVSKTEIERRVDEVADILQLQPMLHRHPHELSGGQQQRTALARAIVKDSQIILLDEPLANLDYKLREELRDQLPSLFADRGTIVIYATSEPSEALLLGGNTAAMHQGRVSQFGATNEIYRQPNGLITAEVFSDPPINIAPIQKAGNQVTLLQNISWPVSESLAELPDGKYFIAIQPHFISPTPTPRNTVELPSFIKITELSGSHSIAHFDLHDQSNSSDQPAAKPLTWVANVAGTYNFTLDKAHSFYLDPSHCQYFDQNGDAISSNTASTTSPKIGPKIDPDISTAAMSN